MTTTRLIWASMGAAAMMAFAGAAQAESISPASNTNLCLDMGNKTDLQPCRGDRDQNFEFHRDGTIRVEGGCLAVYSEYQPLVVTRCGRGQEVNWSVDRNGTMVNGTGLCADVNKGKIRAGELVIAYRCNGQSNQRWSIGYGGGYDPGPSRPPSRPGNYTEGLLSPQNARGMCMDVRGGASDVIIYRCHGKSNQRFQLSDYGDRSEIRVQGNCLTAPRDTRQSLYVTRCNGSSNQLWTYANDGTLRSANGNCADVYNGDNREGTSVILFRCSGRSNQRFDILR